MELDNIQNTGLSAIHRAAETIRQKLGHLTAVATKRNPIDLVTEADVASEKVIIETIRSRFPDHAVLGEESGLKGESDHTWIIDPLDGTTNFAHGVPLFSISIAYAREDGIRCGWVLNPVSGELFSAARGCGATLNGKPVSVSGTADVSESLLVTGFPYNFKEILPPLMARFTSCLTAARGVRRLGSAALDLCFVACGRFEGFWEQNLSPWDTAAGYIIAAEAGATVTDFSGNPFDPEKKEILATNGNIHKQMLSLLELENDI